METQGVVDLEAPETNYAIFAGVRDSLYDKVGFETFMGYESDLSECMEYLNNFVDCNPSAWWQIVDMKTNKIIRRSY